MPCVSGERRKPMLAKWIVGVVVAVQLIFLASIIREYEAVRTDGQLYKLELQVRDPYDLFRGNFLVLSMKEDRIKMPDWQPGWDDKFYVKLQADTKTGFAKPVAVSRDFPGGDNWIQVRNSGGMVMEGSDTLLLFAYPMDRYYLNEDVAKTTEEKWNKALQDSNSRCWMEFRLKKEKAVITDLKINGRSLREIL